MSKSETARHGKSRSQLLATVSAAALLTVYGIQAADAAGASGLPVWLSFAWHTDLVQGKGDPFSPDFISQEVAAGFTSPLIGERQLNRSYGDEGKITFQPEGSDWIFSASVQYGRAHSERSTHEQTTPAITNTFFTSTPARPRLYTGHAHVQDVRFLDAKAVNNETHIIMDFEAGKDVGLGMLGHDSTSTFSVGVRLAQLRSQEDVPELNGDPDFAWIPFHRTRTVRFRGQNVPQYKGGYYQMFHQYFSSASSARSFQGIGPSIAWNASAALYGTPREGEVSIDWGISAAALFGRQRERSHHHSSGSYRCYGAPNPNRGGCGHITTVLYNTGADPVRSHKFIVPDLGGTFGISYRFADFKFSAGYRADYFLHAIDAGVDARHDVTRSFRGPFASVSVGIGD